MRTLTTTLCLAVTAITLQAQSSRSAPDFAEARRLIREGMAKDSATAVSIAVVRDGKIIWEEGFGWADREKQVAVTPNTPFQLASLAKTFEATLAAVLHERRRLDLDRPVNDYLRTTGVSSPVWNVRGTTIRRLLMHTGGLSTFNIWCALPLSQCRFPSADEMIRQYGIIAQDPGGAFDYSNLGYFVASEAVARAAGRPLRDLLRDEVFRPLGMADASFGLDSAEARRAALGFSWGEGLIPNRPSPPGATDYANARGFASAHDLALFAAFHLKAHRPEQRAILSDAAIDSMQLSTVVTDQTNGQGYGLGWWTEANRYGYRSVLAQGGTNLAQARLRLIPSEGVAVAVLINTGAGFGTAVTDAALAAVLPRYADGLAARAREQAAQAGTPAGAAPVALDSTVTGSWKGMVRTKDRDIPLDFTIAMDGEVQARIGSRAVVGTARVPATSGRLLLRIPGDLEAANRPGQNLVIRFYLRSRGSGFGGHVTTRPPSATGLDGDVTYWAEITRPR